MSMTVVYILIFTFLTDSIIYVPDEEGSVGHAMFAKASHQMGDQNLLSRAPPCFAMHVEPLVPAAFAFLNSPSSFLEATINLKKALKFLGSFKDAHVLPKLLSYEEYYIRDRW
jgi:hypothetical protein